MPGPISCDLGRIAGEARSDGDRRLKQVAASSKQHVGDGAGGCTYDNRRTRRGTKARAAPPFWGPMRANAATNVCGAMRISEQAVEDAGCLRVRTCSRRDVQAMHATALLPTSGSIVRRCAAQSRAGMFAIVCRDTRGMHTWVKRARCACWRSQKRRSWPPPPHRLPLPLRQDRAKGRSHITHRVECLKLGLSRLREDPCFCRLLSRSQHPAGTRKRNFSINAYLSSLRDPPEREAPPGQQLLETSTSAHRLKCMSRAHYDEHRLSLGAEEKRGQFTAQQAKLVCGPDARERTNDLLRKEAVCSPAFSVRGRRGPLRLS